MSASDRMQINWHDRQLHWICDDKAVPLASWAIYWLEIGKRLAAIPHSTGERLVAGFVLPVLDYAAVLTTMGLVCSLARHEVTHEPNPERFARLAELPAGHPVRVLTGGKLYNGHVADLPGERTATVLPINVSKSANATVYFRCTPANCMRCEPTQISSAADHEQRGLRIIDSPSFVSALLDGLPLESLCLGTRHDYVLIGTRAVLLSEASAEIAVGKSGKSSGLAGTAHDVIRMRNGAGDYRGIMVPATVAQPSVPDQPPRVVIFSGAAGFLRLRHRFPSSHHVVLIDRSEPRCLEAVNQLNRQFFQRSGDGDQALASVPPCGVEEIIFLER
jgi:hypothetical protein